MERDQTQWLWLNRNVLERDKSRVIKKEVTLTVVSFVSREMVYFKTDEFLNKFCFCVEKGKGGKHIQLNRKVFIHFWDYSTPDEPEMIYVKKISPRKYSYFF